MKIQRVVSSAFFGPGLAVSVGVSLLQTTAFAQNADVSKNKKFQLVALAQMEGTWIAKGDGFSSMLQYEWALPDVLLRARNELRNSDGQIVSQYEGHYAWDPDQSKIIFWTVGRDGELHRGTAVWRDERLWHEASVSGGRTTGYRSVLGVVSGELVYRAKYNATATDEEVQSGSPLVYRRQPPKEPSPKSHTP